MFFVSMVLIQPLFTFTPCFPNPIARINVAKYVSAKPQISYN